MKYSYDGQILVIENFKKIIVLTTNEVVLLEYRIKGTDLKVVKLDGYEIWIKGNIKSMEMGKNEIQAKDE